MKMLDILRTVWGVACVVAMLAYARETLTFLADPPGYAAVACGSRMLAPACFVVQGTALSFWFLLGVVVSSGRGIFRRPGWLIGHFVVSSVYLVVFGFDIFGIFR